MQCSHKLVCVTHKKVYRNNQALQAASREPGARIVSVTQKEIYRTIKLCKQPTECHSQKKITEQSSFESSQLSVIQKQSSETIKLCKQPAGCHSQTIFRNNQALQAATKEFRTWIRIVLPKQFTEQSNFAKR
jgi:hypothetical protein